MNAGITGEIKKITIAIINAYQKFDAVFEPVAGEMSMAMRKYSGIKPMADDLNSKALPVSELALIIVTGTSEENDEIQYKRNINLLEQVSKHSKLKSVPVLFLGYRGDSYLQAACTDCSAAYLDLPVRKSLLVARIRELIHLTPQFPLPEGEGEIQEKLHVSKPLSLLERGAAEPVPVFELLSTRECAPRRKKVKRPAVSSDRMTCLYIIKILSFKQLVNHIQQRKSYRPVIHERRDGLGGFGVYNLPCPTVAV